MNGKDTLCFDIVSSKGIKKWSIDAKVNDSNNGYRIIQLLYNPEIFETLWPEESAKDYIEYLYGEDHSENSAKYFQEKHKLYRYDAFGKSFLTENAVRFLRLQDGISDSNNMNLRWQVICFLQSALLYFKTVAVNDLPSGTTIGRGKMGASNPTPISIAIVAPLLKKKTINSIRDKLCHLTANSYPILDNVSEDLSKHTELILRKFPVHTTFTDEVQNLFLMKAQRKRAELFSLWLAYICKFLYGKVHEGYPLDFWFVIGDQTEFEDKDGIDFKHLFDKQKSPFPDVELLEIRFDNEEDIDKKAEISASILEKEHFPWFQRGKCALFWDVSGKLLIPTGLVSLQGSNWEQFASQLYVKRPINIPSCVVLYISGSFSETGIILKKNIESKPLKIMEYKNKEWRLSALDERRKCLCKLLKEDLKIDDKFIDDIVNIVMLVADNPKTGGTIVLLNKNGKKDNFLQMGKPWELLGKEVEDKVALISHDGATLLSVTADGTIWCYRYLLTPEKVNNDIKSELQKIAYVEKTFPLSGAGTRRWSAGLAVFRDDIDAVIVISQDGDINCWVNKDDIAFKKAKLKIFRKGETPEEYDFGNHTKNPLQC